MFCTKCGHKNPAKAKFCAACGQATALAKPAKVETMSESPALESVKSAGRKILGLPTAALAGIAGLVVVGIVLAFVFVFGAKPMPNADNAEDFLMKKADFDGLSLKKSDQVWSFSGEYHNFFIDYDNCAAATDVLDLANAPDVFAQTGFYTGDAGYFNISETIYSFDSEADAQDFIDAVADGGDDDGCDANNIGDVYDPQGTIEENFGVNLEGAYIYNKWGKSESGDDRGVVVARRSNIVLEIGFRYEDWQNDSITKREIENAIQIAIERFAGIRRD